MTRVPRRAAPPRPTASASTALPDLTVLEAALDPVIRIDEAGQVVYWNPQAERVFGWSRAEAMGRPLSELIIPTQYRVAHRAGLRRFLEVGDGPLLGQRVEITALHRDGHEFPVELTVVPAITEGRWTFTAFVRDIRERHDAVEALRASERRFRALVENSSDVILLVDRDGTLRYASPSERPVLGYGPADNVGRHVFDLIHPDDAPAVLARFAEALEQPGARVTAEFRARHQDGSWRWVEAVAVNRLTDPDVGGVVVNYRDITERRRSEEELRRSEERLRLVGRATNDAIWDYDLATGEVWWSESVQTLFGYSDREIEPGTAFWERRLHPDERERVIADARAALEGSGAYWHAEYRFRRGDGSYAEILDRAYIIRDASGHAVRMIGSMMDVTARRQLEAQFRQAQKLEAVGRLAGGIAHDFNNLLTAIIGYAELLLQDLSPHDPRHADVREIHRAAERAAGLTRQLLAYSRKQVLQPRVLDLNDVVRSAEQLLARLIGEDVSVVTRLEPALGRVTADPNQIEQVIVNLAVNARDAMPRGGTLILETANAELDAAYAQDHGPLTPGRYVMLSVSDTGIGMDAETRSHLFEPFFTTKGPGKGTGLGLAQVYGTVKQSGGYVWVYSEPGIGTTFKIYLPRVDAPAEAPARDGARQPLPGGRETILLVEDEESVRSVARGMLRRQGYTVLEAADARQAMELAERHAGPIHLLIADVVMPEIGGREVAARITALRPEVRVLYVSGYTEDAIAHYGVLDPAAAFLEKPFTPAILARRVRELLDAPPPVVPATRPT
ncbi:MAG TPA: PAS domain S-box protein [Gemmatimonadales bacterium]|nr:PAS domain S-box protein [Gemmatimonadales bacterium]